MNFPKYRLQEETVAGDPGTASAASVEQGGTNQQTNVDQGVSVQETADKVQSNWPDNWRELYAGQDEKKLSRLSRYASPQAAIDAMIAAQNKISSGEYKSVNPFPEKGTPEEQNQWRQANGIPEAPDKYDFKLPAGVALGEYDKPIIEDFAKYAHSKNLPNEAVAATINWYMDFQERNAEQKHEARQNFRMESEDKLRAEWGQDYRRNLNVINALLDQAPQGIKDKFLGGSMADGTPIGNDPDMLRYLASLALQINPHTTLVPGAGANVASAIEDEIGKLETLMQNRGSEYWKGPTAEKNQQRYRELVGARDKMKKTA
jgi:hypothetical protein